MEIRVNPKQCTGCGACMSVCPVSAISIVEGIAVVDHSTCTLCQRCIKACPPKAISIIDLSIATRPLEPQPNHGIEIITEEPVSPQTRYSNAPVLVNAGLQIIPRLVNMLISTLEHHLTQPSKPQSAISRSSSKGPSRKKRRGYHHRMHNRHR